MPLAVLTIPLSLLLTRPAAFADKWVIDTGTRVVFNQTISFSAGRRELDVSDGRAGALFKACTITRAAAEAPSVITERMAFELVDVDQQISSEARVNELTMRLAGRTPGRTLFTIWCWLAPEAEQRDDLTLTTLDRGLKPYLDIRVP